MANTAQSTLEVTPRHLWLALIGGAEVARRGAGQRRHARHSHALGFPHSDKPARRARRTPLIRTSHVAVSVVVMVLVTVGSFVVV